MGILNGLLCRPPAATLVHGTWHIALDVWFQQYLSFTFQINIFENVAYWFAWAHEAW